MLSICIHRMKHFIHVICDWKLETVSAAHRISLVLALPRNISIGSEHETFAFAYRSAAVRLYIFFLEKWCKCNVLRWMVSLFDCCFLNLGIEEGRHKYWISTFMPLYTSKGGIHLMQLKLNVDCNLSAYFWDYSYASPWNLLCWSRFTSEDPCASFNVRDHEVVLRISIFSLSCP